MLLTDQEREKFIAWLEQNAASNEGLAAQLEQIGPPELAQKLKVEAMASRVIAGVLRNTESVIVDR